MNLKIIRENVIIAMIITNDVYQKILHIKKVPPETGGILGSRNGEVVDVVCHDISESITERAVYVPNVVCLNAQLELWRKKEIFFAGMFHSHKKLPKLSMDDRTYIKTVMDVMPGHILKLYFPVIIPDEIIISYQAIRESNGMISILEDSIKII